jgi:hypothetical protein
MSADVLSNNLTNPAKSFLWEVMFTNPIGGGDAKALETRCQTASIPGRSFGSIIIPFKGTAGIKFPGKLNMDHTWSTTFVESTADQKTFNAIYAWKQAVLDAKTGIGGPDIAIKSNIYLKCLDQAGNTWLTIKMTGCYPENMSDTPLSYAANEEIRFSVTWAYDRWEKV